MGTHKAFIASFQRDGHWLVSGVTSTQIQLSKSFGRKQTKAVSVLLERNSSGRYSLTPVTYAFKASVSHFDYFMEEERWIRNKNVFRSLVKTLQRVKMWDGIDNKDSFIQVNPGNKKANKTKISNELKNLFDNFPKVLK